MKEIILLQHADCEGPGTIGDVLDAADFRIRTVRGDRGDQVPQDLGNASGLVVMGGPMGVYEYDRYPFLRSEMRLIEKTVYGGLPVLGVCLGSQLLAAALGAKVEKGPRKEIGWYPVSLLPDASSDRLFGDLPNDFEGFHWHGDIFGVPDGATALARSELTACQAFRFDQAYGILFHRKKNGL